MADGRVHVALDVFGRQSGVVDADLVDGPVEVLAEEVAIVFNTLTGLAGYPGLKKLLVAPFDLHSRLISLIEREHDHAAAGKPARIVAKLNSLVDQGVIEKLYEASCQE